VQIFDSWAGELSGVARRRFVVDPLRRIVRGVKDRFSEVPVIVFARGVGCDHATIAEVTGAEAIGVEAEENLAGILTLLGGKTAVQGNLDPVALLTGDGALREEVLAVIGAVPMARHIFNLGHGIRPETDLNKLSVVIDTVRSYDGGAA
jgi:uroporphyrinogen decarboxylase